MSPKLPVCGSRLPSGANLLSINDEIVPDDGVCARLSKGAWLIACYANETVMQSFVAGWVNGTEAWSVFHDGDHGIDHLETSGDLPDPFDAIKQKQLAEQQQDEDTDCIFDIPVALFEALGEIRYDRDIEGAGPEPWQVLARR